MDNDQLKPSSIAQGAAQQDDQDDEGLALGEIIAVVFEYRWLAAAITAIAILLGAAWIFVAKPEYRASGLLEVEEQASGALSAMKDLGPLLGLGGDTTVAAEQEILSSRMVLERVINKQKLKKD